jgi:hypothetical protein
VLRHHVRPRRPQQLRAKPRAGTDAGRARWLAAAFIDGTPQVQQLVIARDLLR